MASSRMRPDDPDLNDHIFYAKCIKGHVLKDANDWILCENLPSPDSKCWQEGGETLFALMARRRSEPGAENGDQEIQDDTVAQRTTS
jgi:hypothetical protein